MFQSTSRKVVTATGLVFVRFRAHKYPVQKIPIQLLKDVPNVGVRGEILQVKPAFMRNYLHHKNKACYITPTQGPRIDVVTVEPKAKQPVEHKPQITEEPTEKPVVEALSMDELSDLFKNMTSNVPEELVIKPSEPEYTIAKLTERVPSLQYFMKEYLPITKEYVKDTLKDEADVNVPVEEITLALIETPDEPIEEITMVGKYLLKITSPTEDADLTTEIEVR